VSAARRVTVVLACIGALAVAALGAVLWAVGTESGTAWLARRVLARAPGVSVTAVRGSLLRGVVLEDVRVRLARDELDIARLALEWDAAAALGGTLALRNVQATSAGYRRTAGDGAGSAAPLRLPFDVRVRTATVEALTLDVAGTRAVFGPTQVSALLEGSRLTIERVVTSTQGVALEGNADVGLDGPMRLRAAVQWSGDVAGTAAGGSLTVDGTWPALTVTHDLAMPFPVHAQGTLDFAGEPRADLAAEWRDLAWPGVASLASPNGRLTVAGTVADYRYDGAGALAIEQRAATFAVRGAGHGAQLVLERLELAARNADASAGVLVASGDADLGARTLALRVDATDANPAWWRADLPGRLRGNVNVRAALSPVSVAFDGLDVSGTLRGFALTLRGAAGFTAPDQWQLAGVRLQSADNRVAVDGALTAAGLTLAADVDARNLDALWPGLDGAVNGKLTIGGTFAQPTGRGRLTASKLAFGDYTVDGVAAEGVAGDAPDAPLDLRVEVAGAARGPVRIDKLLVAASGTTAAHRVTLDFDGREWRAHAAATGALAERVWRGSLAEAVFDENLLGRWQLTEPAAVTLGSNEAALGTTCLEHPSGGRWCAALDVRGRQSDRLVLAAQNFELRTLRPLLPPALALEGVYQLSASLFDVTGNPRGALVLTGERTRVSATTGVQQTYATELDELRAGVTLNDGRLELLAALRSGDAGKVDLTAGVRDVRMRDSAITGTLAAAWPDVGFLTLLAPELGQLGGAMTGQLTIGGSVEEPEVDGSLGWQGGRVAVPQWGLVIDGIEANAASRGGRALNFDAKGRVGDGEVTLTGDTSLDPDAGWPTRLTLRGNAVRAVQIPEAEIFVTPDLTAAVTWPDVRVTGKVDVPRAKLGLSALPAQAVAPSADAVVHGRDAQAGVQGLRLTAAIDMTLGDDVRYSGLDLDTKVTGALHVEVEPARTAIGMGTLTLAGTYNAYGQKLMLERGQLVFAGPLDDPGVDVRAVRTIDTTRVGVELVGTVKAPRTRVFSTPSMSEADALSYLLFGRPMTGSGTQESATLETAAIAMGLNQALPVVRRLGTTLGLDELSVETTATDAGALMAGKYLSPKLYIRYSYGLFNRIGGLLLRFKFNERLSIETRSGDQKSMDLLYTVEKD
jgi:translocation and assembly module TamB